MRNLRIVVIIVIIITMFGLPFTFSQKSLHAQSLEDELEQIKKEREETKEKIEEVKKQEQSYMNQVSEVESQLLSALSELEGLNGELAESKSEVDKTTIELVLKEQELSKIEEELEEKAQVLNERVASIYKNKNGNILEVLFKAKDFIEFISKLKLMNLLAEQDTEIVQLIKDKKNANLSIKQSILDLREKQKEYKNQVEKLVGLSEEKTSEIEGIYGEKKNLLSQTRTDKNTLMQMEKQLEVKESEIKRILESYKYGSAPGGKLLWPAPGYIKSGFGWRIHPIFGTNRFHSGVDIVAPYGALVKAADGGQVIQAEYSGGYGYTITLYHGGGFATRYAHLSGFNVSMGQFVERGQVIGFVGSTGWSTGPHLHFEVRINGNAQNPVAYL